MGAGGMGGYADGLLAAAGADVTFIARGAHLEALPTSGRTIETPDGPILLPKICATADPAAGLVDLVVLTVKLADAEVAAAAIVPLMGETTRLLPLQNSIDSRAILERHVGPGQVAVGIIYVPTWIEKPVVVRFSGGSKLMMADALDGDPVMAELFALSETLKGLDIESHPAPDAMVWRKFVDLVVFSGATCLALSQIGRVRAHPSRPISCMRCFTRTSLWRGPRRLPCPTITSSEGWRSFAPCRPRRSRRC
jgi:2-dehydropantoate 2-reductase